MILILNVLAAPAFAKKRQILDSREVDGVLVQLVKVSRWRKPDSYALHVENHTGSAVSVKCTVEIKHLLISGKAEKSTRIIRGCIYPRGSTGLGPQKPTGDQWLSLLEVKVGSPVAGQEPDREFVKTVHNGTF